MSHHPKLLEIIDDAKPLSNLQKTKSQVQVKTLPSYFVIEEPQPLGPPKPSNALPDENNNGPLKKTLVSNFKISFTKTILM